MHARLIEVVSGKHIASLKYLICDSLTLNSKMSHILHSDKIIRLLNGDGSPSRYNNGGKRTFLKLYLWINLFAF